MTTSELRLLVDQIAFPNRRFVVKSMGDTGSYVQVEYDQEDIETGKVAVQRGRKWYVSSHACESEVVRTVWAAILMSLEHDAREHFTYKGRRVMSPHFDINEMIAACDREAFEKRETKKKQVEEKVWNTEQTWNA